MAAFPKMTLTNAGQALQTKVLAGAQLTFTRIALGDGQLNDQPISLLTDMIHQTASVEVDTVRVMSASTCQVAGFFSNATISTGFQWRETGLFAQDPAAAEQIALTAASASSGTLVTIEVTPLHEMTSGKLAAQCGHAAQLALMEVAGQHDKGEQQGVQEHEQEDGGHALIGPAHLQGFDQGG